MRGGEEGEGKERREETFRSNGLSVFVVKLLNLALSSVLLLSD